MHTRGVRLSHRSLAGQAWLCWCLFWLISSFPLPGGAGSLLPPAHRGGMEHGLFQSLLLLTGSQC